MSHASLLRLMIGLALLLFTLLPAAGLAATAAEINAGVDTTLAQFKKTIPSGETILADAKGVLVFPKVLKIGVLVGAQYGEGALRIDGRTVQYYSVATGSLGLQLGVQRRSLVLVFFDQEALDNFRAGSGWEIGGDLSVAMVDEGAVASGGSITHNKPIAAFVFDQQGAMINADLGGTKFTKIDR